MGLKDKILWKIYRLSIKPVNRLLVLSDRFRNLDFYRGIDNRIDDGSDYECTHLRMHGMLKTICEEAGGEDAILDVGCGKGRMLWFFSQYPFRLVDGIEYDPEIAAIARSNLEKLGLNSRVFLMDVCDGVFPNKTSGSVYSATPQERKEFEEERRLFYVGMTRAKNDLNIFTLLCKFSVLKVCITTSFIVFLNNRFSVTDTLIR